MKPGKRLREGRENDAPAKRTPPAHHWSTQMAASPGNGKSGHPHGIQDHIDLDGSDEPMAEAVPSREIICYGAVSTVGVLAALRLKPHLRIFSYKVE